MKFEESFVQSADGTQIQCLKSGVGKPIILLHGLQRSAGIWFDLLSCLPLQRQFILPNLRGRGKSGIPLDMQSYRLERFVDDLEAVVQSLEMPVAVLGWSMGASVAWAFSRRPCAARVSHWIFVSGTPDPTNTRVLFKNGSYEQLAAQVHSRVNSQAGHEVCETHAAVAAWLGFRDADFLQDPPKLTVPRLMIHGDQDHDCPIDAAIRLARLIDSELIVFEGAQHNPMKADPARFAQVLTRFLEGELDEPDAF